MDSRDFKKRSFEREKEYVLPEIYGRVPPQAKDLEEAVLGVIMLEKNAFEIVNDILKPDCFYSFGHQRIYSAMQALAFRNDAIDQMTVVEQLKTTGDLDTIGGPYFVSKLTNKVTSGAGIETHARVVLQKFLMREVIRVGGELVGMAYDDTNDVFDVLDFAEENVSGLRMNNVRKNFKSLQTVIHKNLQELEVLRQKEETVNGVPSLFEDLDNVTCGWQETDLIILAARPSVGKTAFALTLAKNAAKAFQMAHQRSIKEGKPEKQKAVGFF